jgi:hypothetical protein
MKSNSNRSTGSQSEKEIGARPLGARTETTRIGAREPSATGENTLVLVAVQWR